MRRKSSEVKLPGHLPHTTPPLGKWGGDFIRFFIECYRSYDEDQLWTRSQGWIDRRTSGLFGWQPIIFPNWSRPQPPGMST
ncbi:unnamed protein product [Calypogeia fissa]